MHAWIRHRSAPLGVLLAGAIALLATSIASGVFYLSIVRQSRGLPAYTVGIPGATIARPLRRRASYSIEIEGPVDRRTPAGTATAAHRWRVVVPAAPDDALCEGEAYDALVATDDTGARPLELPLPRGFYVSQPSRDVPLRILATCPLAATAIANGPLEYSEEIVPRGTPAEAVGCVNRNVGLGALTACDDGAPSRIYPREQPAVARARARGAMLRVALCAGSFAFVCFLVGVAALRRFDRERMSRERVVRA